MTDEFARLVNTVDMAMNSGTCTGKKWFISFGTLLWFIRDMPKGKPLSSDIDISMMYGSVAMPDLVSTFESLNFKLRKAVLPVHDAKHPFQATFQPTSQLYPDIDIDIWFWIPFNGRYWHCGDFQNQVGSGVGLFREYTLKGIPQKWIDGKEDIFTVETAAASLAEIAPPLNLPKYYGTLLDYWYPPTRPNTCWFNKVHNYGMSKCLEKITIKSLKEVGL